MSEKTTMRVNLRNVQEQVEDSVKQARVLGRKAILAYAGFWGLAYDRAQALWADSKKFIDDAEKRGEELEHDWVEQFNRLQKNPDFKKVASYVEEQVDVVSKNTKSIVAEVEKFLAAINPSAGEAAVAKDVAIKVEIAVIEGYDEMNVKDIVALLPSLSKEKLQEVRAYEAANKNRVTVLREIDTMLETPEEAVAA